MLLIQLFTWMNRTIQLMCETSSHVFLQPNCYSSLYISFPPCIFSLPSATHKDMETMTSSEILPTVHSHLSPAYTLREKSQIEPLRALQLSFQRTLNESTQNPTTRGSLSEIAPNITRTCIFYQTMALVKLPLDWCVEKRKKTVVMAHKLFFLYGTP